MADNKQLVMDYIRRAYNQGDARVVRELCADPYTRHYAGLTKVMTHDEQEARVASGYQLGVGADGTVGTFGTTLLAAEGTDVTWIWNYTASADCPSANADFDFLLVDDQILMCGIEIFRVADGRITDVWNQPPQAGHWG